MKKENILAIAFGAAAAVMTVMGFALLPETVITQFATGGGVNTMPKLAAVGLPALLGIGGAVAAFTCKEKAAFTKALIVAGAGIFALGMMLAVNL